MTKDEFKAALKELGYTQDEAATTLGVSSQQQISSMCTGKRRVMPSVAAHVHSLLRMKRAGVEVPQP